jgi:hypothetical protein
MTEAEELERYLATGDLHQAEMADLLLQLANANEVVELLTFGVLTSGWVPWMRCVIEHIFSFSVVPNMLALVAPFGIFRTRITHPFWLQHRALQMLSMTVFHSVPMLLTNYVRKDMGS